MLELENEASRPRVLARTVDLEIDAAPAGVKPDDGFAVLFSRLAMLSFVLLGALILKVLTQQNILTPGIGILIGFIYALHLLFLSLIPGRLGALARETSLFQCAGLLLAFVIAFDTSLRTNLISPRTAILLIAGSALLGVVMAVATRKIQLAATATLGCLAALVSLRIQPDSLALQISAMTAFALIAVVLSWRHEWPVLRWLAIPSMMVLLGVPLLLDQRFAQSSGAIFAAACFFYAIMGGQHLLQFGRLGKSAIWLPLTTCWFFAIGLRHDWTLLAPVAIAIQLICLACFARASRSQSPVSGTGSLVATIGLSGMTGWTLAGSAGLFHVLSALALWFAAGRKNYLWPDLVIALFMASGAIFGMLRLIHGPLSPSLFAAAFLTGVVPLLYYLKQGNDETSAPSTVGRQTASVALVCGLAVLVFFMEALIRTLIQSASTELLLQTAVISFIATTLTYFGRMRAYPAMFVCGLLFMLGLSLKVCLLDLMRLTSLHLLGSAILLALSCVGVSLILRQPAPRRNWNPSTVER